MSSQRILGELEQAVLLALLRLGDGATGAAIHDDVQSRSSGMVAVTAIYVTLARLQGKGMVRATAHAAAEGGRPLKRFALQDAGLEALRTSRYGLDRLWEGIDLESATRER